MFVHWCLLFCIWFIWWVDHSEPICLFTGFYSSLLETYLFVHWVLRLCKKTYLLVHWFLLFCDKNLSICLLICTRLARKIIYLCTCFYSSVIEIHLFVHWCLLLCDINLSVWLLVLTPLWYKSICFSLVLPFCNGNISICSPVFFYSVIKTYLFVCWFFLFYDRHATKICLCFRDEHL